jgi:hypothetical protein
MKDSFIIFKLLIFKEIARTKRRMHAIPHNFTHRLTSLKFLVVWGREENRSTRTKTLKTQERQAESCSYSQPTLATY